MAARGIGRISPARSGYHVEYWFCCIYLSLTTGWGERREGGGAAAVSDYTLPLPLGTPFFLGMEIVMKERVKRGLGVVIGPEVWPGDYLGFGDFSQKLCVCRCPLDLSVLSCLCGCPRNVRLVLRFIRLYCSVFVLAQEISG